MRLTVKDALDVDNRAFTIVGNARKAQVLAVTPGNRYLLDAFNTPTAAERADVRIATPEEAKGEPLAAEIRGGRFDLIIYDGVKPRDPARGQRPLLRRAAARAGLRQAQGDRAAGHPRLEHLAPADAVHPRPLAGLRGQGQRGRASRRRDVA